MDWDPAAGYPGGEDITNPVWMCFRHPVFHLDNGVSFSFDGAAYHLVVRVVSVLIGICIPLSSKDQPFIRLRIPIDWLGPAVFGLDKACSFSEEGVVARVVYGWDSNKVMNIRGSNPTDPITRYLLFSEEIGRCITMKAFDEVEVIDFLSH